MAGLSSNKSSGTKDQKFRRHEKSIEERKKRQAAALRTNLKKRKDQMRQRSESN